MTDRFQADLSPVNLATPADTESSLFLKKTQQSGGKPHWHGDSTRAVLAFLEHCSFELKAVVTQSPDVSHPERQLSQFLSPGETECLAPMP